MLAGDITQLLNQARTGEQQAQDLLFDLVYDEIRKLADVRMSGQPTGHTLQPTALANEAVVKILQRQPLDLGKNRIQFFALIARAMGSVLVDYARRRNASKRHPMANHTRISLDAISEFEKNEHVDLLCLDESLRRLQQRCHRMHEIVVLHFFGGLQFKEIAEFLAISTSTVEKDWYFARAWLRKEMSEGSANE